MSDERITCGLCGESYSKEEWGFGNNAMPLMPDPDVDRCCDRCNDFLVIPARMMGIRFGTPEQRTLVRLAGYGPVFSTLRSRNRTARKFELVRTEDSNGN